MVQVDGTAVPLLDGESVDELERDGELVIGIIHRIWVGKKYAERTGSVWVEVRLGAGSHDTSVSHRRSVTTPTVVPESEVECERDAQCVTKALALLHKPVVLPDDVDFKSVPALLCTEHRAVQIRQVGQLGISRSANPRTVPGDAIELFCANAKPDEEYIFRCYYDSTNTSLHCFAVKDFKIADPLVGEWYDVGRFCASRRDKDSRRVPCRAKEAQAPQARGCHRRQARVVRRPASDLGALSVA